MKKETYEKKLDDDLMQAKQFCCRMNLTNSVFLKVEKDISKELLDV